MTFCPPVQQIAGGATSGTGKTFGLSDGWEAPLAGNGILVIAACADRLSNLTTPSGYTVIPETAANGTPVLTGFAKIADGTETSILIEWSRSDEWAVAIFEIDTQGMGVSIAESGGGDTDTNTNTLSSTSTTSVQGFGMAVFASLAQNGETPSYTNSFVHLLTALSGGSSNLAIDIGVGSANADSAGTYESTATWASSTGRCSKCLAGGIGLQDGEWQKDYQRSSTYKIVNMAGQPAYIDGPGNGIEQVGLNRGQARKNLTKMVGNFRLEVEH